LPCGFSEPFVVYSWCFCPSGPRLALRASAAHVADPLRFSPCPAALRPLGLASPPAVPQSACPHPPARPGGLAHPRGSPLRYSWRGRAAAARAGTLCASAGRWGSPADATRGPRRSALHHTAALRSLHAVYPGAPVLVSIVPFEGLGALSRLPPSRPLPPALPPPPRGGAVPAVFFPASFLLACGGPLGWVVRGACPVVPVVFGWFPGPLPRPGHSLR
jgi:hypothetical protein